MRLQCFVSVARRPLLPGGDDSKIWWAARSRHLGWSPGNIHGRWHRPHCPELLSHKSREMCRWNSISEPNQQACKYYHFIILFSSLVLPVCECLHTHQCYKLSLGRTAQSCWLDPLAHHFGSGHRKLVGIWTKQPGPSSQNPVAVNCHKSTMNLKWSYLSPSWYAMYLTCTRKNSLHKPIV